MQVASERYRLKAQVCERLSREASDEATKVAWAEIAIEWHALANRVAQEAGIRANIDNRKDILSGNNETGARLAFVGEGKGHV